MSVKFNPRFEIGGPQPSNPNVVKIGLGHWLLETIVNYDNDEKCRSHSEPAKFLEPILQSSDPPLSYKNTI